eukprot:381400_1
MSKQSVKVYIKSLFIYIVAFGIVVLAIWLLYGCNLIHQFYAKDFEYFNSNTIRTANYSNTIQTFDTNGILQNLRKRLTILIGSQKCATSSLKHIIHDQISRVWVLETELHYFDWTLW